MINAIAKVIAYMARNPAIARHILTDERLVPGAVEEFVRWISPLSFIGRVCPTETKLGERIVPADGRVGLCWASANHDSEVFEEPTEYRPDRRPNPHMGFGSGKHACLGAAHARSLMRVLVKDLAELSGALEIIEERPKIEQIGTARRRLGYERLLVSFGAT